MLHRALNICSAKTQTVADLGLIHILHMHQPLILLTTIHVITFAALNGISVGLGAPPSSLHKLLECGFS